MDAGELWKAVSVDDVTTIDWRGTGISWRPMRHELDLSIAGLAAFTGEAGATVIEPHVETTDGRGQEELYIVLSGRARFTIDSDEFDAAPGLLIRVDPAAHREAVALEAGTVVLALGGESVYEPSASEWIEPARPCIRLAPDRAREIIDDLKARMPGNRAGRVGDALLAVGRGDESAARAIVSSLVTERPEIREPLHTDPDLKHLLPDEPLDPDS